MGRRHGGVAVAVAERRDEELLAFPRPFLAAVAVEWARVLREHRSRRARLETKLQNIELWEMCEEKMKHHAKLERSYACSR